MSNIYNDHILYDSHVQYGGLSDFFKVTNTLILTVKPSNEMPVEVKSNNVLVERISESSLYYWRILAGMPMGLLLSLTYPIDQDGEIRT